MKTNQLTGAALDWAVAKAENETLTEQNGFYFVNSYQYSPSTNWAQGGQIIEREGMSIGMVDSYWQAHLSEFHLWKNGETPLIAAMRCHVANQLGDEIDVLNIDLLEELK
jgi:hypothetical protein